MAYVTNNFHKMCAVSERIRSWVQAAEIRVVILILHDRMKSSVIRKSLAVELLFLWIERNQLKLIGHLIRMQPGKPLLEPQAQDLLKQLFLKAGWGSPKRWSNLWHRIQNTGLTFLVATITTPGKVEYMNEYYILYTKMYNPMSRRLFFSQDARV